MRNHLLLISGSAFLLAAALFIVMWKGGPAGVGYGVALLMAASVTYQYLRPGTNRGGPDVTDPLFQIGTVLFLAYGLRSIHLINGPSVGSMGFELSQRNIAGTSFNYFYSKAVVLGLICWVSLMSGYRIRPQYSSGQQSRQRRILAKAHDNAAIKIVVGITCFGWLARMANLRINPGRLDLTQESTFSPLTTMLTSLSTFTAVGLAASLLLLYHFPGRWGKWWVATLILAEFVFGWATNGRTTMFSSLVMLLAYIGLKQKVAFRMRFAGLLPVALLLIGASNVYRGLPRDQVGLTVKTQETLLELKGLGLWGTLNNGFDTLLSRYHGVDSMAAILSTAPMDVPRYGLGYLLGSVSPLIPRFIWTSKPYINYGQEFSIHYFGYHPENSVPLIPTWFGDLAIQFHPLAVPPLCILLGITLRHFRESALFQGAMFTPVTVFYLAVTDVLITADGWIPVYTIVLTALAVKGVFVLVELTSNRENQRVGRRHASRRMSIQGEPL